MQYFVTKAPIVVLCVDVIPLTADFCYFIMVIRTDVIK